jgi:hypothetical protein
MCGFRLFLEFQKYLNLDDGAFYLKFKNCGFLVVDSQNL